DNSINVLSLTELKAGEDYKPGITTANCGVAVIKYIEKAVDLIKKGLFEGVVTCPISKKALKMAGYDWPGHTEFIAYLDNSSRFAMMLTVDNIRVVLVTTHIALKDVPKSISKEKIIEKAVLIDEFLRKRLFIEKPKIGILSLNPHAGEGGNFGDEEIRIIEPAIKELKEIGIDAYGPLPSDSAFYFHKEGVYDAIVAMYHDQGIIPVKFHGFDRGINVTLGLSFIRTSPDHGTAFEISGKGVASINSFVEAYRFVQKIKNPQGIPPGDANKK
ncbi:MAG: 4-hydroxythreonine-4-phosphate dehydrogenase PdxA, partial [candidate division WOR-3 bacterium]